VIWERAWSLAKSAGNTAFPIVVKALSEVAIQHIKQTFERD
jgi:hypothetical protein